MQILATALFFIVFIELFAVLSVYLWVTISTYLAKQRKGKQATITKKEEV